jgi:hypothetical protein
MTGLQEKKDRRRKGTLDFLLWYVRRRRVRKLWKDRTGQDLNLEAPRTFQEKIQFRKVYGNHETYAALADKYRVRDYVSDIVGEEFLIPLLAFGNRLRFADFAALPDRFIIKATHGCGWNLVVRDKGAFYATDAGRTVRSFNRKLRRKYSRSSCEYHYDLIRPRIVIEELLLEDGGPPWDYRFFCFRPPSGFDFTLGLKAPAEAGPSTGYYDSSLKWFDGIELGREGEKQVKTAGFSEMVEAARSLSEGLDFVRVDLYNIAGRVFFSEMTFTPSSGFPVLKPNERRQRMWDGLWRLDTGNGRLYDRKLLRLAERWCAAR